MATTLVCQVQWRISKGEYAMSQGSFKVFKTLKLPVGATVKSYHKAINGKKIGKQTMCISSWASDIMGKSAFTVVKKETELDLVVVSVKKLTGKNQLPLKEEEVFARAKEKGLELCPAQAGPELRLQYPDQPEGEWLLIGMEPITDSDGDLQLFSVERGGSKLLLHTRCGRPGFIWHDMIRFVFVRPCLPAQAGT